MTKNTADAAWTPFIHRSIDDYQNLPPVVREAVLALIRRQAQGAGARLSPEALFWWNCLPGLPRHNKLVFAGIDKSFSL